jgi:hypothetical protein
MRLSPLRAATPLAAVASFASFASFAFAQPTPVASVPFRIEGGLAFFDATVNGRPAALVFDTGAPEISLDPTLVDRAGVRVTRAARGANGVGEGRADSIRIGGALLVGEAVRVRSFAALNDGNGATRPPLLGVVGTSFFRRFVARFDFAAQRLDLFDPATYAYAGPGAVLPVTFVQDKPVVRASLALGDGRAADATLFVDAGSANGVVLLTPQYAKRAGIGGDGARVLEVAGGRTLYGSGTDRVTRLPAATVGAVRLTQPVVTVSEGLAAAIGTLADGTIGLAVLSRTTMILDYARSRIILEPGPGFDAPFAYPNVSGLQFQRRDGALVVRHVIAGSPADSAGVKAGDELVAIDDAPVGRDTPTPVPQLRDAGATRRLTVRRGGETRTVTIVLRELI